MENGLNKGKSLILSHHYQPRGKRIMYLVAFVHLTVCVCLSELSYSTNSINLKFRANGGHYHSEVFVCVSAIITDVVDRLLIIIRHYYPSTFLKIKYTTYSFTFKDAFYSFLSCNTLSPTVPVQCMGGQWFSLSSSVMIEGIRAERR